MVIHYRNCQQLATWECRRSNYSLEIRGPIDPLNVHLSWAWNIQNLKGTHIHSAQITTTMQKMQLSWLPLGLIALLLSTLPAVADSMGALDIELPKRLVGRTERGIDIPILRRQKSKLQRRDGQAVSVGIGDYQDVYVQRTSCPPPP